MAKNAVDLLIDDHNEARREFERIATERGGNRQELWDNLANALKAHVTVEKELFYPRVIRELGDDMPEDIVADQHKEETEATEMLEELVDMGVDDPDFDGKFQEFRDTVLKHAEEVEEGQLFPLVKRKVSNRDLEDLGREMAERKTVLLRELRQVPAR